MTPAEAHAVVHEAFWTDPEVVVVLSTRKAVRGCIVDHRFDQAPGNRTAGGPTSVTLTIELQP